MKSKTIIFTGLEQAELVEVDLLDEPAPHEFTIQTRVTLMSMGTELACYRADSEPGSHWHGWVKHPFFPGYSCVGEVIKVGSDIEWLRVGERIFHTTSHRQYANLPIPADQIVKSLMVSATKKQSGANWPPSHKPPSGKLNTPWATEPLLSGKALLVNW